MKILKSLLLIFFTWLGLMFIEVTPTAAAQKHVLLVYDSQNSATQSYKKIDSLQRLLTSHQLSVKTIAESQYRSGMLRTNKYAGVITMVNWPQNPINNRQFQRDRQTFSGIKLHIGGILTRQEASQIGGRFTTLHHQQLTLIDSRRNSQLLPFTSTMTVFKKDDSKRTESFGTLTTQEANQRKFVDGVVRQHFGYLPFYSTDTLNLQIVSQLIAALFQTKSGKHQPLLTITNVTPYSNLKLLNQLSRDLYEQGIAFAVSTTTVETNTELSAFKQFTKVLRNIETRNGIIFLKTPIVSAYQSDQSKLNQLMVAELTSLGQNHVFPVGISTDGFWNQDALYRNQGLKVADHVLLLPNSQKKHQLASEGNSQVFKQSYYALAGNHLLTVQHQRKTAFQTPTAITFSMPTTRVGLRDLERKVSRLSYRWFNPQTQLTSQIEFGSANYQYRQGNYFLNGSLVDVTQAGSKQPRPIADQSMTGTLNHFF
ncbi:hypothetical protein [Lentilactobacillus kisonensis]|nr:hypothetical protein [Lentilactobacillus kisonensis]